MLHSPHIKTVYVVEGESDLMRLMTIMPQGLRSLVVAAPGCSWRPTVDYCFLIGAHRNVVIWMDNDQPGRAAASRLAACFRPVSGCNVISVHIDDGTEKDICDMSEERIFQIINSIKTTLMANEKEID